MSRADFFHLFLREEEEEERGGEEEEVKIKKIARFAMK